MIDYRDFPRCFDSEICGDPSFGLLYGHLSTVAAARCCARCCSTPTARSTRRARAICRRSARSSQVKLRRLVLNLVQARADVAMRLKWFAEKHVEPRLEILHGHAATQAMGRAKRCLVSRNEPMHDSVPYLRNALPRRDRHPARGTSSRGRLRPFVDGWRAAVSSAAVNLLNASVRVVHREDVALPPTRRPTTCSRSCST